ncbi:MAG: hypothetical protein ACO3CT_04210 [Vulcanococcus sp.]
MSPRPNGTLMAECSVLNLAVSATDRDALREEAREALINAIGPAHVGYRLRLQKP